MGGLTRKKSENYRKKRRLQSFLSVALTVLLIGVHPLEGFAYAPVVGTEEEMTECQTAAAGERLTINGVVFEVIDASANTLRVVGYTEDVKVSNPLGEDGGFEGSFSDNGITYTITEVADGAFAGSKVQGVYFPSTITSFGKGILEGCDSLSIVENDSSVVFTLPELEPGYVWYDIVTQQEYTAICDAVCVTKTQVTTYTITFNSQGGTAVDSQVVREDGLVKEPEAPTKEGYRFGGWYTSSACTGTPFDFSTKVTQPYSLYAKWTEVLTETDFTTLTNPYSASVSFGAQENKWYCFTPSVAGTYTLDVSSTGISINYYGTDYTNGSPAASGATFSGQLEAGKTYYFRLYCSSSTGTTATLKFSGDTSVKKNISTLTISDIGNQTYTGSAICPGVTIRDGETRLTQGTDYEVSYSNNTNAGMATATITGKDKYEGSVSKTFAILQAEKPPVLPASAMTVSGDTKTVGEVSLDAYPDWSWQDGTLALTAGGTVEAVAEYKGSDKTNYKQTTVTVSITREIPRVTDFTLNATEKALKGGETFVLQVASVTPSDADASAVDWSSNNTEVAEVTDGKVRARGTGTAEITATINGISKTCTVTVTNPCTAFELSASQVTLIEGNTYTLSVASTTPVKADAYSISWTSNLEDVVTVSDGMLTALKEGSAIITARLTSAAGTFEKTCKVTVNAATEKLTDITVEPASMNLKVGETGVIQVTPEPENASLGGKTYASQDTSVAAVNEAGVVTAKKSGTTVISITAGEFTKECRVTVTNPLVSFSLNKTVTTISAGSSETLVITTTPTEPDAYKVDWTSNNTGVAKVDGSGNVMGVSGGTAIITATINGIQKQCTVKVEEKAAASYTVRFMDESGHELECRENLVQGSIITLPAIAVRKGYTLQWKNKADGKLYNQGASVTVTGDMEFVVNARKILVSQIALNSTGKTIEVNENFVLGVNVKPEDAFDRSVQWSSSDTRVAVVDSDGRVTGVAAGNAVVKAAAKDGSGIYAVCHVTVTEPEPEYIGVKSLKITGSTKKVAPGKKITLKVTVSPANAENQQVIWSVSNKKYASVNSKGVVTTKKAGKGKKVTVTAVSAEDGSIKATYKISIMKNAVKKIKLTGKTTLKKGKSTTIKAKFTPAKNISKELTWTSSNKKIATVSSKGKVTAKKKGKVKITARAKDGSGKKATITIRVK